MAPRNRLVLCVFLLMAACTSASGRVAPGNVRVVPLSARLVIAQTRQTLTEGGFQILSLDSTTALWATHSEAGTSFTRCMDVSSVRRSLPRPMLVIVSASDTVGGSKVRIEVLGWRPGEYPPLALGLSGGANRGPCLSTGAKERELFAVLDILARRRGS